MASTAKMQESQQPPNAFLTKTYRLVDDPANLEFVSWNEDGTGFIVKHSNEFARDVLPRYFKHDNFSSFVRQLNSYGFKKVSTEFWEFSHEFFKRDKKELLGQINRRQPNAAKPTAAIPISAVPPRGSNSGEEQVISSNSSPMDTDDPEIIKENKRLKRENASLRQQLNEIRSYWSNVQSTMANVAAGGSVSGFPVQPRECTAGTSGVAAEESGPRLFGVPIGKRVCLGKPVEEVRGSDAEDV